MTSLLKIQWQCKGYKFWISSLISVLPEAVKYKCWTQASEPKLERPANKQPLFFSHFILSCHTMTKIIKTKNTVPPAFNILFIVFFPRQVLTATWHSAPSLLFPLSRSHFEIIKLTSIIFITVIFIIVNIVISRSHSESTTFRIVDIHHFHHCYHHHRFHHCYHRHPFYQVSVIITITLQDEGRLLACRAADSTSGEGEMQDTTTLRVTCKKLASLLIYM